MPSRKTCLLLLLPVVTALQPPQPAKDASWRTLMDEMSVVSCQGERKRSAGPESCRS